MTGFRELKSKLTTPMTYKVSGSEWGLACNAVHFIDLVAFFADSASYTLDLSGIERELFQSKRQGFVEFYGVLRGEFDTGDRFELECYHGENVTVENLIRTNGLEADISGDSVEIRRSDGSVESQPFKMEYQSDLTHLALQQLLTSGTCDLTPYRESMDLHIPFISLFGELHSELAGVDSKFSIT